MSHKEFSCQLCRYPIVSPNYYFGIFFYKGVFKLVYLLTFKGLDKEDIDQSSFGTLKVAIRGHPCMISHQFPYF